MKREKSKPYRFIEYVRKERAEESKTTFSDNEEDKTPNI